MNNNVSRIMNEVNNISQVIDKIKELCIDALCTDGGHHKQWYLEQILITLGYNLDIIRKELQEEDYDWDDGIAP